MALVSAFVLYVIGYNAYYEYYLYPREKGSFYIYPEWRYTFFDACSLIWAVIGILAAVMLVRSAIRHEPISRRAQMLTLSFVILLAILIVGGVFVGPWLRSLGWQ